jgi:hypothetical protein
VRNKLGIEECIDLGMVPEEEDDPAREIANMKGTRSIIKEKVRILITRKGRIILGEWRLPNYVSVLGHNSYDTKAVIYS